MSLQELELDRVMSPGHLTKNSDTKSQSAYATE